MVALTREPEVRDFVAVAQSGISGSGELRRSIVIVHYGHDQVGSLQRILALRRLGQLQVSPEDEQKHRKSSCIRHSDSQVIHSGWGLDAITDIIGMVGIPVTG